jgi:hypothetical protein
MSRDIEGNSFYVRKCDAKKKIVSITQNYGHRKLFVEKENADKIAKILFDTDLTLRKVEVIEEIF